MGDAGIYEFTMGIDGSKVKARYSFIYVYEDGQWKISHHHSSVMPEAFLGKPSTPSITEQEVGDLFHLWNDALATGDPKKVAERYARNAVLLPTVSDEPRTTAEKIEDYFVDFLKKKPQGVVLSQISLSRTVSVRMLVYMSSLWELTDLRSQLVTLLLMYMKMVSGRLLTITPVQCLRV